MSFDIGITQESYKDTLVQVVHPVCRLWNPDLYLELLKVGGAMSVPISFNRGFPGEVDYDTDFKILVLKELTETLTVEEREALLVQQLTHIKKGHLMAVLGRSLLAQNRRKFLFVADYEAARAVGASVVRSSLEKVLNRRFQIMLPGYPKIAKIFTFIDSFGQSRERLHWLQVMIDRGM